MRKAFQNDQNMKGKVNVSRQTVKIKVQKFGTRVDWSLKIIVSVGISKFSTLSDQ